MIQNPHFHPLWILPRLPLVPQQQQQKPQRTHWVTGNAMGNTR